YRVDRKCIARHAIWCLSLLVCLFSPDSLFAKAPETINIGVNAIWGNKVARKMWQPSIDYLNTALPNYNFVLKPVKLHEISQAVSEKQFDFITTNPGNYIELETKFGVTRLLTLNKIRQGIPSTQFGAIIFTRADKSTIKTIYDARGKSFVAVSQTAFGGFQMAWRELKSHGIDPFKDIMELNFSGFPQDKVVYAVRDNKADVGTVRTDTMERMAREGLVNLADFRILAKKQVPGFPFLLSTQLYPEWPFAKLAHTNQTLAKMVTSALLNLKKDSTAAKSAKSVGWTVPMNYQPVRDLMKELKVGPYKNNSRLPLIEFIKIYWWLLLAILLSIAPPIIAYIKQLKSKAIYNLRLATEEAEWNHALDFLDEPVFMVDLNDRLIRANRSFYETMGTQPGEAIGEKIGKFCHSENISNCPICLARQDKTDAIFTLEENDPANSFKCPVEVRINIIHDKKNTPIAIIEVIRDLSHLKHAESAIRQSESRAIGILNATPDPLLIVDEHGCITMTNHVFEKQFGYTSNEIIGKSVDLLVPNATKINHSSLREAYMHKPEARPKIFGLPLYCLHKNGQSIPVEISLSPVVTDEGALITVSLRDITDRLESENELNRLASFPEHSPIPIIEFNNTGDITYSNPIANHLFPELSDSEGKHVLIKDILKIKDEIFKNNELIRDIEVSGTTYEQKITYISEQGLFRIYFWDITKIRDMTREIAYQATHDSLTRLINRAEFEVRLEQALQTVKHENKQHVLCYIDLDQFKIVNDTCGHIAGDELLKQISSLLQSKLRDNDTLARLGGDEFGLLLTGCPVNTARSIAEKLRTSVENYRFTWQDKNFKIGMSIGLVPILEQGLTVSDVLSSADTACYIAKEHGRNRVHTYNSHDSISEKHTTEMNWVHRIHNALEEDRLSIYVQQILNLANPSYQYYEVLIRMQGENGEIIPPLAFLPAAERYGLISQIDKYVIEQSLKEFSKPAFKDIHLSINLSGQSLSDHNIMNFIIKMIDTYNFDASRLTFEVTETVMVANLADAIRFISTLKGLGCRFALDDFGSGFSSFAYLKNLPVDLIKIDGGFVRDMLEDPINSVMVESMIYIGHNMNLKTVAEFVENVDILNALQDMGIDFVQGYGIARPVALKELLPGISNIKSAHNRA
ncbi:MAG: EAL domain-containing protein, partial [Gammaproteobacteria bacterium]|nr:EAL domain-containing protein [Gammaproteobacteria bacterium]